MTQVPEQDLVPPETLVPQSTKIHGAWTTKYGKPFMITGESIYRTSLTDTSGAMICIPHEEITSYIVSNTKTEPDFSDAIIWALLGCIPLGFGFMIELISSDGFFYAAILSAPFFLVAWKMYNDEMDNQEATTTVTLNRREEEQFTTEFDEAIGEEVATTLTNVIPQK